MASLNSRSLALLCSAALLTPGIAVATAQDGLADATPTAASELCSAKVSLDRGHVDIKAIPSDSGFDIAVKDETLLVEQKLVERPLDTIVLAVHDNAKMARPETLADPQFDYLGPVGQEFYLLPQTQKSDVIWPGYNTQALDYSKYSGTVNLHITPRKVPEGATWGLFLTSGIGSSFDTLVNSLTKDYTIETTYAAHTHTNWAFSKPGIYELEMSYTATAKDGSKVASAPQVLTIAVGDAGIEECKNDAPAPTTTAAPATSAAPVSSTAAPKPTATAAPKPSATAAPKPTTTVAPTDTTSAKPAPTTSVSPDTDDNTTPDSSKGTFNAWAAIIPVVLLGIFGAMGHFFQEHGKQLFDRIVASLNLKF